jgi:hypothetical protein
LSALAAPAIGDELSTRELNFLADATEHMDVWIGHLCQQTDEVLRAHGLVPAQARKSAESIGRRIGVSYVDKKTQLSQGAYINQARDKGEQSQSSSTVQPE